MNEQPPDELPMLQVGIQGPEISRLADLNSIVVDVALAQRMALRYLELLPEDELAMQNMSEGEQTQLTALWRAGLISYRRAFSSGRALLVKQGGRLRIEEADLAHLTDSQRETHEQVLAEANQVASAGVVCDCHRVIRCGL